MANLEELSDEQRTALMRAGYQLLHNPEVSKDAKRLLMRANPKLKFPEIEAEEHTQKALKSRDEKLEELERKLMDQEMRERLEVKRRACRDRGLDPDEVEALIVERGKANRLIDFESAMELIEMQKQTAAATPATDGSPVKPMLSDKDLWNDPAGFARKQTIAAIDELNQARRRRA